MNVEASAIPAAQATWPDGTWFAAGRDMRQRFAGKSEQLSRQGPREREDQAQAGRSHGAHDLLGPDQEDSTRKAIGIVSLSRNESWQTV